MMGPGQDRPHEQWPDEIAAYLLGALPPEEAREVERHLDSCERCRTALSWALPAINALAEDVEQQHPPASLRAKLIAETRRDAAGRGRGEPARSVRRGLGPRRRGSGSRPFLLWPTFGLLAIALMVVAVAAYKIGTSDSGGTHSTTITDRQPGGVVAEVIRREDESGGTLRLTNVHPVHGDHVLEAWVQRGEEVMPVRALFVPDDEGNAETMLPDMTGVKAVMVTVEPRGGSEQPTSEPFVAVPVPVKTSRTYDSGH